mgnify:CR=1 FL=1
MMEFFNAVYAVELVVLFALLGGLYLGVEKNESMTTEIEFDVNDPSIGSEYLTDEFPNGEALPSVLTTLILVLVPVFLSLMMKKEKRTAQHLYHILLGCLFILSVGKILISPMKVGLGQLRPDFLGRCEPEWNNVTMAMECTGDPKVVQKGRCSFPSGHAQMAWGIGVFILFWIDEFYINAQLYEKDEKEGGNSTKGRVLQVVILLLVPFGISLQRLLQNKHHPRDVAAGAVWGIICAMMGWRWCFVRDGDYKWVIRPRGEAAEGGAKVAVQ